MQVPELAAEVRRAASTTCWSTSTRTPTRCRPRSCSALKPDGARPDRGRRRRPGDLRLPRRHGAQHPRLSRAASTPPARDRHAGAELPLDPADPRRLQRRHRPGARALHQEPALDRARPASKPALVTVADDVGQVELRRRDACCANREDGMALKEQAVLFRTSHHSAMLEIELTRRNIPFVKFGGLKFLEAAHVKDMLAVLRWAENPTDRVTGFRVVQLLPGIGPATAGRGARRTWPAAAAVDALATFRPPAKAGTSLARRWSALMAALRGKPRGMAGRVRAGAAVVPAASRAALRRCRGARRRSRPAQRIAAGYPSRDAVPDRPDARSAQRHQRRGRRAAARRGLPDPVDHPLRQGPGVEGGVRAQRGRRLHPLRHGDRQRPRRSRRSGGCSTWP